MTIEETNNNIICIILLCVIPFVIVLYLFIHYWIVSKNNNYDIKKIKNTDFYNDNISENHNQLITLAICKVNGWNTMTLYYTVLHYVLNIFAILFSCISIYFVLTNNDLSVISSFAALISVTYNLFLRCDRKWATFRQVLAEGRKRTNTFLAGLEGTINSGNPSPSTYILEYANDIIELEKSLKDSDLT